ncbi:hypothetical protein [Kitasatospora sp. NPDC057015]|uniref:hypothetical protein n=1 Tax=Kitasatospora sp. NPDC057015 TaxID=3346001 RepID=UPI0036387AFC
MDPNESRTAVPSPGGPEEGRSDRAPGPRSRAPGRLRAVTVLLLVLATCAGFAVYRQSNAFGPGTVCGGISTDAVQAALGPGRVSETLLDVRTPSRPDASGRCSVAVRHGLFVSSETSASIRVRRQTPAVEALAAADARLFTGAATGGASPRTSWALLPEHCAGNERVEVTVAGSADRDADRATGLARLAVAAADVVAARSACSASTPAPKELSAAGTPGPADFTGLCGLPGLAPRRNPSTDVRYREQATTAFAPLWSCEITDEVDGAQVVSFAVSADPRIVGAATDLTADAPAALGRGRWVAGTEDAVVATCHGRPVYFLVKQRPLSSAAGRLFPDRDDLWHRFLGAAGTAIGCEPVTG